MIGIVGNLGEGGESKLDAHICFCKLDLQEIILRFKIR